MRMAFSELFSQDGNWFTPKQPVSINGCMMTPGAGFQPGTSFGGFDLTTLQGKDLEVERDSSGVVTIKGHY